MPPPSKLCLTFIDRLGIVADLARTLSEHAISITAMEVEVDPDTHRVRIYLALDTRQSRYPWQDVQQALANIHGLHRIEPVSSLPRERREAWLRLVDAPACAYPANICWATAALSFSPPPFRSGTMPAKP